MTFRDENGLWRENDWHELATPEEVFERLKKNIRYSNEI